MGHDDLTPCPTRHSRTKGACSSESSRLSCHPRRHTQRQLGQRDRRPAAPPAESGPWWHLARSRNPSLRPIVAALAQGDQRRPEGRRRVRRGASGDQGTCRKAGPAWWTSRGGPPRRGRVAGEPSGPGMRNPGLLARMGAMGSHPSRGPGGASRIACTPPGSKRVSRVSAASTSGAFRFTHATGKPRRRTPLPLNLWLSFARPRRG